MLIQDVNKFQGTAQELIAANLFVNGQPLDAVAISVLAKYGFIKKVGVEQKAENKRGKAGAIFEVPAEICKVIV